MNLYFIFSNLITTSKIHFIIILFYFLTQHSFLLSFQLYKWINVIEIYVYKPQKY
jgi:hypothetical protein